MGKFIDITGQKYNRLTVLYGIGTCGGKHHKWHCRCDCGKEVDVAGPNLKNGHTKSCGCLNSESVIARNKAMATHHGTGTPLFQTWSCMFPRCYDPRCDSYERYGGRGIKVCDEWHEFEPFRDWALEHGYEPGLTTDRIDPNGDYEPNNCRFLSPHDQSVTRSITILVEYNGLIMCLKDWANAYGVPYLRCYYRYRSGWDIDDVLNVPAGGVPRKPLVVPERYADRRKDAA